MILIAVGVALLVHELGGIPVLAGSLIVLGSAQVWWRGAERW